VVRDASTGKERMMASLEEEIAAILVDCYGEEEERAAWEVAFADGVAVPFRASLLGMPVEVQGFRVNNAGVLQCQVIREKRQHWVGIEDLDEDGLPEDFRQVLKLYRAWAGGEY
jgi:hypothetical protein